MAEINKIGNILEEAEKEIAHNEKITSLILECPHKYYVKLNAKHIHKEDYVTGLIKRLRENGQDGKANQLNITYQQTVFTINKYI